MTSDMWSDANKNRQYIVGL